MDPPLPPKKKREKRLTSVRPHPCAPKLESPRRRRGGKSPDRGGRGTLVEVEMAVAAKEANTVVTSTGKEGELVKRSDMAMVIELVGNAVFMLEFMLIVWFAIKTVILFPGWKGVLLVVFISPAAIMVLVLTRLLKKDFVRRHTEGYYDAGVNQPSGK
uniref:Uncharacterized protein n=1 Tax=Oryza meridionalis TaxID=40149 RepID=A0A0E0F3Q3_9ORYZ